MKIKLTIFIEVISPESPNEAATTIMSLLSQYCWCNPAQNVSNQLEGSPEYLSKLIKSSADDSYQTTVNPACYGTCNYGICYSEGVHHNSFRPQKKRGSMLDGYNFVKEVRKEPDGTPNIGKQ